MTLNITTLTHRIIYQSADFRLTIEGKRTDDTSAKTVTLTYTSWIGFVTYTGLGKWQDRYVSDWIAGWLTGIKELTIAELADHLAEEGTKLLGTVYISTGKKLRHTFTLAGFEGGDAVVYVISNFENCFGESRSTVDDHLTVSCRKLRKGEKALVVVTGCKAAVFPDDRRTLSRLTAKYATDGGRIRRRIESLNAKAASSTKGQGLISKDCVVLSFSSDGSGVLQLNDAADEIPKTFPNILFGMDVAKMLTDTMTALGADLTKAKLVQQGSQSNMHIGSKTISKPYCTFEVATPDLTKEFDLIEIQSSDFEPASPRDINDCGQVVGTGRPSNGPSQSIPWIWESGKIRQLTYAGLAQRISNGGHVAATLQEGSNERAGIYQNGTFTEFPLYHGEQGVFEGTDSAAFAINSNHLVVGQVRSRTEEDGRPNTWAAIFRAGETTVALEGLRTDFGCRAIDINDRGDVLLVASPKIFQAQSLLWDITNGSWSYIGDPSLNIYPIALTNKGVILGQTRSDKGDPIAVIYQPGEDWARLGTDQGWVPIGMNDRGDVVGWAWIGRIQRPWIRFSSGKIDLLPYVTEHHTTPSSINNVGQIVGTASADHGAHALLWRLVSHQ